MNIGVVGHEAAKFTKPGKRAVLDLLPYLLPPGSTLISGGCHLGGVDIWAEEYADANDLAKQIFLPARRVWNGGYRERNIQIANASDVVYVIVVTRYPDNYLGMRFPSCYHCGTSEHIKSGACWTARRAKEARWHLIANEEAGVPDGAVVAMPTKRVETERCDCGMARDLRRGGSDGPDHC